MLQALTRDQIAEATMSSFGIISSDIEEAMADAPALLQLLANPAVGNRAEAKLRGILKKELRLIPVSQLGSTYTPATRLVEVLAEYTKGLDVADCYSSRDLNNKISSTAMKAEAAGTPRAIFKVLEAVEREAAKSVDAWLKVIKARAMKAKQYGPAKRERSGRMFQGEQMGYTGAREARQGRDRPASAPVSDEVVARAAQIANLLPGTDTVCYKYLTEKRTCGSRCRRVPCNGRLAAEFEQAFKATSG